MEGSFDSLLTNIESINLFLLTAPDFLLSLKHSFCPKLAVITLMSCSLIDLCFIEVKGAEILIDISFLKGSGAAWLGGRARSASGDQLGGEER